VLSSLWLETEKRYLVTLVPETRFQGNQISCKMHTLTILIISFVSWLVIGYVIAKLKVGLWRLLFIENKKALDINLENWRPRQLISIGLLWPFQTCFWILEGGDFWENYRMPAIPITPIRLFSKTVSRSNINYAILNDEKYYWSSTKKEHLELNFEKKVHCWGNSMVLLGGLNIVVWIIEFIMLILLSLIISVIWLIAYKLKVS